MRLHLDCSYTRLQRGNVGITRVVRGLAHGLPAAQLGLVAYHSDGFRKVESLDQAASPDTGEPNNGLWQFLYRLSGSNAVRGLVKAAVPVAIQVAAWRLFSRIAFSRLAEALPRAEIRAGDVVVVGDAGWTYDVWSCVDQVARDGARIATIVYDLIPVNQPQFCAPAYRRQFAAWLQDALRRSDAILCISEATRAELERYCRERQLRCPPTASFRLGGDLPPAVAGAPARESIRKLAGKPDYFLTVGSIEPRKNHALMLDAFEHLWQRGIEATLVVVGRPTDDTQATVARIQRHSRLGRSLFLYTDASDAELDLLYRGARAVILATLAEGFGLPLAEARQRGCEVIASRLPAFEEIADDGVRLFAPGARAELATLVEEALAAPRPARPSRMPAFSWRDSAQQFIAGLGRALRDPGVATPHTSAARNP
jgi:glycosyltransferase involved in cell wall biosynthesis